MALLCQPIAENSAVMQNQELTNYQLSISMNIFTDISESTIGITVFLTKFTFIVCKLNKLFQSDQYQKLFQSSI